MKLTAEIGMKKVLFVCTANRCRSVMAEWGFRDLAERKEVRQVIASSAGVAGVPGSSPTENTLVVLSERGIDATEHRARLIDRNLIEEAGIVLGMTRAHIRVISSLCPGAEKKAFLLGKFSSDAPESDIDDPFGLRLEDYRKCFEAIESCFVGLMGHLQRDTV